jgi:hypothetical protein
VGTGLKNEKEKALSITWPINHTPPPARPFAARGNFYINIKEKEEEEREPEKERNAQTPRRVNFECIAQLVDVYLHTAKTASHDAVYNGLVFQVHFLLRGTRGV